MRSNFWFLLKIEIIDAALQQALAKTQIFGAAVAAVLHQKIEFLQGPAAVQHQ